MLKLTDIVKDYKAGDNTVRALNGISVEFRKNEFVSVLGASGCGKTTLLNIIGGLDRYTSGQLSIDGQGTDTFKAVDWDLYRNQRIGFIFQSYNLIPQISILANVELALTLSGVPAKERKERAVSALEKVGLGAQLKKKPNQLSGGQMQRVSIARALINNPEIILADEPTGALDSTTSIHVMELLKEIASDKLVIMVTHNPELAEQYSTRIIRMQDGRITDDSDPYDSSQEEGEEEVAATQDEAEPCLNREEKSAARKQERARRKVKKRKLKKTSMGFFTALALSFQNIRSKAGRNAMTVGAGSIGIICVCLVLGLSTGLTNYINSMGEDMLSASPLIVNSVSVDFTPLLTGETTFQDLFGKPTFPDNDEISGAESSIVTQVMSMIKTNEVTPEFVDYVKKEIEPVSDAVVYDYAYDAMILSHVSKEYEGSEFDDFMGQGTSSEGGGEEEGQGGNPFGCEEGSDIGNVSSVMTLQPLAGENYFDMLAGRLPSSQNEVVLVVSGSNTISNGMMAAMGLYKQKVSASDFIGKEFKLVFNNGKYAARGGDRISYGLRSDYTSMYSDPDASHGMTLKICGVIRPKKLNDNDSMMGSMSTGLAYGSDFMPYVQNIEKNSEVVKAQRALESSRDLYDVTSDNGEEKLYKNIWEYIIDVAGQVNNIYSPIIMDIVTDFYSGVYPLYSLKMSTLGAGEVPVNINIYTLTYGNKDIVTDLIEEYNVSHKGEAGFAQITYTDAAAMMTSMMNGIVGVISVVLICFTSVSLIVSSVMIGIITYISVVERTKEIGILRSLGARKTDVARVFIAESLMIGLASGIFGAILAYLISIPLNLGLMGITAGVAICVLKPQHALMMVGISAALTIMAGSIPSYIASRRDPVIALRSE